MKKGGEGKEMKTTQTKNTMWCGTMHSYAFDAALWFFKEYYPMPSW